MAKVPTFDLTVRVKGVNVAAIEAHNRKVESGYDTGVVDPDPSEWDFGQLQIAIEGEYANFDVVGGETGPDEEED